LKLKIENTLQAAVNTQVLELASRFLKSDLATFSEQVAFLKLNPASDFRHADLAQVDFSDSDLRGFDFTGADLRGCFGVNIRSDETTCFDSALTDNSVFSYALSKRRFFDEHPEYADRVERLRNEHWANVILTVEAMLRADRHSGDALKMAQAIFDQSDSLTVKAEILLYMSLAVQTKDEHKAFIYNALAQFDEKPSILRSCIRTLRSLYVDDLDAFNMMTRFIDHPDERVAQEAATGVLSSKHLASAPQRVRESLLSSGFSVIRRAYVERIAKIELRQACELLLDNAATAYIDFAAPISNQKILTMARRSLSNPNLAGLRAKQHIAFIVDTRITRFTHTQDGVIERAGIIKGVIESIGRKYGIPFDVERAPIPED
jgi:hypothetical protein